jgi:DNA-binding transcriptional ArsR family regulator
MTEEMSTSPRLTDVKADLFKAMGHPSRILILQLLAATPQLAVSDLRIGTGLEASNLSQHLAVLRRNHLIRASRQNGQVVYELAAGEVKDLLRAARLLLSSVLQANHANLQHAVTVAAS